jgi:uncharacterized protein (TIGR02284 family)
MSTVHEQQITVLNGLIETTLDSALGYREAATDAKNSHFKSLFEKRSMERRRLTTQLQAEVRTLGGEPEADGTILASAHRMFLNLKNKMTGSDQSIVDEVEAGEDHIKAKFERALKDNSLSAPVKGVVGTVYAAIKADHDQMRDLKHELQATH